MKDKSTLRIKSKVERELVSFAPPLKVLCLLLCGSYWILLRYLICPCSCESLLLATGVRTWASSRRVTHFQGGTHLGIWGKPWTLSYEERGGGGNFSCSARGLTGSLKIIHEHYYTHVVRVYMLRSWSWHQPTITGQITLSWSDLGNHQTEGWSFPL